MQYTDSAAFLRGIVKRGRKYYLGVTTITQDVDDFLQTPYGKEIVTNSAIQILLKQHSAAIEEVGKVFYLSEGEKQLLLTAEKGRGIFFAGQNHVAIRVIASEEEHRIITSNPEEILKWKSIKGKTEASRTTTKAETGPVKTAAMSQVAPAPTATPPATATVGQTEERLLLKTEVVGESLAPKTTADQGPRTETELKLENKIQEMEKVENIKLEEHQRKIEEEKRATEKQKLAGTFSNFGPATAGLPKYGDLFKSGSKLPPLPPLSPLPKFQAPKATVVDLPSEGINKALFINQKPEPYIPQPPQLKKKPKPVFEIVEQKSKASDGIKAVNKMSYDDLFGGIK
jgi:hypothetical protein